MAKKKGFNWGAAGTGAASGAAVGGMLAAPTGGLSVPAGALIGGLGGLATGFLDSGGDTVDQQPLETPEQNAARRMLLNFAQYGKLDNGFQAGAEVPLGYGNFDMTGIEGQGQSALQDLLRSGVPSQYRLGDQALQEILQGGSQGIENQFNPFRAQVERQQKDSRRNLMRDAAFSGDLYSTDTIRKLGDVEARGNETLTSQLANLTNESLNRKMQAIPLAYQSAESQQQNALQRIGASQTYGALTRQLNDASIKARDQELLRRRTELQLPIQALSSVAGTPSNFGMPSVTTSPYQDLLGMVGKIGGNYLGNELTMSQYQRRFPGQAPGGWQPTSGNIYPTA